MPSDDPWASASEGPRAPDHSRASGARGWSRLVGIMDRLREEGGCPWDREQTWRSLEPYLIEEAYEVKEALEQEAFSTLPEELGDLLFQILFLSRIGKEEGRFTIDDVLRAIAEKLVRRHPHVFGDETSVRTADEVARNWEIIKREEGKGTKEGLLDGVPGGLPALHQADLVQQRVAGVGFDWPDHRGPIEKLREELAELTEVAEAAARGEAEEGARVEEEFGDFLFVLVNLARRLGVDGERALRGSIAKFRRRFRHIEETATRQGRPLPSYTLEEMDRLWNEAKEMERRRRS